MHRKGTGWHRHEAEFHVVIMLKGWARFMSEDEETLVEAGDCVHQRPGIVHYLFDYSPDMEYLEIVGPTDFTTIDVEGPCPVPAFTPWTWAPGGLLPRGQWRAQPPAGGAGGCAPVVSSIG